MVKNTQTWPTSLNFIGSKATPNMNITPAKPIIGITLGDINGVGPELIIKTLSDNRLLEFMTPVVFGSNKVLNFYRKSMPEMNLNISNLRDLTKISPKQVNVLNLWEEEVAVTPGAVNEAGGKYAVASLKAGVQALRENKIQALVTAPFHKKNVQNPDFNFTGHTPYLKEAFNVPEVLMLMVAENMRVGLVTEHIPVSEVAKHITKERIQAKLKILRESLRKDFGIDHPRIAVLGLNPHAGDEGLIGLEEEQIIRPAIIEARKHDLLVFGPYSADAFFARGNHERFDGVLAMYHDQGLIPFKSLARGEGVNYTAGLPGIRTSPDHGTAMDIAGKNKADEGSFREAIFLCMDIIAKKHGWAEAHRNPLRKVAAQVVGRMEDEKLAEE
jgi:4-hydroxythreonine-4-phosphate dehydrogenase